MGYGLTYTPYNTNLFLDARGINPDAAAFIAAAGITNSTEINAVNALVNGLQADGIWTKMKAIYPFVGGTATTHKYNLKDPRDLDAAFRLVFNGGWTHSSTGATPNGTNGYADTNLSPLSVLSTSSAHLSFYSRTNINQATYDVCSGQHYSLLLYNNSFIANLETTGLYNATQSITNTTGYYIASRVNNTNVNGYRNGSKTINNVAQLNATLTANNIILASRAAVSLFSTKQNAFTSIGDGLTDTEAVNLYTRVQAYQTALSRQV